MKPNKIKNLYRYMIFLFSAIICLTLTGCTLLLVGATAGAAAGGVAYYNGDLESNVNGDPREVEKATRKAFDSLGFKLISSHSSAIDGEIYGRSASDTKIVVKITSESKKESTISIRVGNFGDEKISIRILDEIKKYLPKS